MASDENNFTPAVGGPCFSLREKIARTLNTGDEKLIRSHLKTAHDVVTLVPGVRLRNYNPLRPMHNVSCG